MPSYKTRDLKESRAKNIAEMRAMNDKAQAESRDLSGEERKRFDDLAIEVRAQGNRLSDAEKLEQFEKFEASGAPVGGEMQRELRNYSIAKAVSEAGEGNLSGLEAEVNAELSMGRNNVRGVMIPTEVILEQRDLLTSGSAGNLVPTDLGAMTDRRRAALKISTMGATVMRGLNGNLELPRLTASGTAAWVAENADATKSDVSFEKTGMSPKTVSAEYALSRRLMLQNNQALEPILRSDLAWLLASKLDAAAISGGGTNEPTGILQDANVISTAGGALSSDLTADLIATLEADDVTGTAAFLTNNKVMATARKLKDANNKAFTLAETFHGQRVEHSTSVPANLGATTDKNALIYGEWASLYLGYWSGIDLLVNPYHASVASKGGVLLHAFLDCDVVVRHPEGFTWCEVD